MKDPVRWQKIEDLFHTVLEQVPEQRAAFLAEVCRTDLALQAEVYSLLTAHEQASEASLDLPAQLVRQAAQRLVTETQAGLSNGQTLSHYRILSLLGRGGMGEVYLAEDTLLGRRVALKLLPTECTENTDRVHRFAREARAASALNHPNIVTIHELGQHERTPFIVTEYVEGQTLRQQMNSHPLSLRQTLDAVTQVASALAAAHTANIIHRDIKPENVMIRPDGLIKMLDFGLAKLTETRNAERGTTVTMNDEGGTRNEKTEASSLHRSSFSILPSTDPGTLMGTIGYMSPEQARGLAMDARTDIFSLGVVLYEMLTGQMPFTGATADDVIAAILTKEPLPLSQVAPEVPAGWQQLVNRMLSKDVGKRHQSCQELLADLSSLKQQLEASMPLDQIRLSTQTEAQPGYRSIVSSIASFSQPLKHHWRATLLALATLVLTTTAFFSYFPRPATLTEKDSILLSDFVNTTGDAVFDDTLKRALAVQLEQSPFLSLFPDAQARETLRFMERSQEERITTTIAQEIAKRRGIKATLTGSIATLGRHYIIALEAFSGPTGEVIAREQIEAEGKEQVLKTLGQAAVSLRQKLGESLSSIQQFNVPLEQATTASLEAFQQFALAYEFHHRENLVKARPYYQRAIELDQNFALAYARLAAIDSSLERPESGREMAVKAFALRDRVSERERFIITFRYYDSVTNEIEKTIGVLEEWQRAYPRDYLPASNLAARYTRLGQYEQSIVAANEALRRNPEAVAIHVNLGRAFLQLNRLDEAQASYEQALKRNAELANAHLGLYILALIKQDTATLRREETWVAGRPAELELIEAQAAAAKFAGQFRQARELLQRGLALAEQQGATAAQRQFRMSLAWLAVQSGNCPAAKREAEQALTLDHTAAALSSARALAFCGDLNSAQTLVNQVQAQHSADTLSQTVWLPVTKATIELQRGAPAKVLELLQATKRYEGAAQFWPAYLRGQAYLRQQASAEASAEFQTILAHRGYDPHSLLYALSYLGAARAAMLQGDMAKARKEYQGLLALWKDADADLPILIEAKKEYERIK